jgi:hypothetical protein
MQEEGSFDEAVKGCNGVFHVAASMQFNVHENEDIGNPMRNQLINYPNILTFQWQINSVSFLN